MKETNAKETNVKETNDEKKAENVKAAAESKIEKNKKTAPVSKIQNAIPPTSSFDNSLSRCINVSLGKCLNSNFKISYLYKFCNNWCILFVNRLLIFL